MGISALVIFEAGKGFSKEYPVPIDPDAPVPQLSLFRAIEEETS